MKTPLLLFSPSVFATHTITCCKVIFFVSSFTFSIKGFPLASELASQAELSVCLALFGDIRVARSFACLKHLCTPQVHLQGGEGSETYHCRAGWCHGRSGKSSQDKRATTPEGPPNACFGIHSQLGTVTISIICCRRRLRNEGFLPSLLFSCGM